MATNASAWGTAWGSSWGNSWGAIAEVIIRGTQPIRVPRDVYARAVSASVTDCMAIAHAIVELAAVAYAASSTQVEVRAADRLLALAVALSASSVEHRTNARAGRELMGVTMTENVIRENEEALALLNLEVLKDGK